MHLKLAGCEVKHDSVSHTNYYKDLLKMSVDSMSKQTVFFITLKVYHSCDEFSRMHEPMFPVPYGKLVIGMGNTFHRYTNSIEQSYS